MLTELVLIACWSFLAFYIYPRMVQGRIVDMYKDEETVEDMLELPHRHILLLVKDAVRDLLTQHVQGEIKAVRQLAQDIATEQGALKAEIAAEIAAVKTEILEAVDLRLISIKDDIMNAFESRLLHLHKQSKKDLASFFDEIEEDVETKIAPSLDPVSAIYAQQIAKVAETKPEMALILAMLQQKIRQQDNGHNDTRPGPSPGSRSAYSDF